MSIVLKYQFSEDQEAPHSSYLELIRDKIDAKLKKKLEKAGYTDGLQTVTLSVLRHEYKFPCQAVMHGNVMEFSEWVMGPRCTCTFDLTLLDKSWGIQRQEPIPEGLRCEYHFQEPVDPKKMLVYLRYCTLNISIELFQKQQEEYADRFLDKLTHSCPFPINLDCDWPDVIFQIVLEQSVETSLAERIDKVMDKAMRTWNKRQEKKEEEAYIHYISRLENASPCTLQYHVDFGEADITALLFLLKQLGASDMNIRRIDLT